MYLFADDAEDHAKEIEHSSLQEKLDRELKELDMKLEQKEVQVSGFSFKHMKMMNLLSTQYFGSLIPAYKFTYMHFITHLFFNL